MNPAFVVPPGPSLYRVIRSVLLAAGVLVGFCSCALYHAEPLPTGPDLNTGLASLRVAPEQFRLPDLKPHPFDPRHGLDMTDVAMLAVVNNPALKTARAQARAGRIQIFTANLLPGPQLGYSLDRPTEQGAQYGTGYSASLAYELTALLTHGVDRDSARAGSHQIDLDLLWQEWQVAQQARLLFLDCESSGRKLTLLDQLRTSLHARVQAVQRGYASGDVSGAEMGSDLAVLQKIESLYADITTARNQSCHALNEMLGLKPDVQLKLIQGDDAFSMPDGATIKADLAKLPERRPDLIALRYGYQSQDDAVWHAVLTQFPGISLGINRARDTSDVHTTGFSVGIGFPFLDGAAAVHAAEATRHALRMQYQQRLDEAVSQVHLIQADLQVLDRQLRQLDVSRDDVAHILAGAVAAYRRHDLTTPSYYDLSLGVISRELEVMDLKIQRAQLQVALETLLGLPPQDIRHPVRGSAS